MLLFDLDGTILDSSKPVMAAWAHALDAMGLPPLPADEISRVIGPPMQFSAPVLLAERGRGDQASIDEFVALFRASITEAEVRDALAYDGAIDALDALRAEGHRTAIVTAKPYESAVRVVEALGITDRFEVLAAPPLARPEPKAETIARTLQDLRLVGIGRAAVMIGDREHDVEAGRAHGLTTIGVLWGFGSEEELRAAGADVRCATPRELPAAVRRALRPAPTGA